MKPLVSFFEIPADNFQRAVKFYQAIFNIEMYAFEVDTEKMAFFPEVNGVCPGAISQAADFKPSKDGVLVSLNCDNIVAALALIEANGGKTIVYKTKIQAEGRGYFAIFLDSEGNRMGLYSDN